MKITFNILLMIVTHSVYGQALKSGGLITQQSVPDTVYYLLDTVANPNLVIKRPGLFGPEYTFVCNCIESQQKNIIEAALRKTREINKRQFRSLKMLSFDTAIAILKPETRLRSYHEPYHVNHIVVIVEPRREKPKSKKIIGYLLTQVYNVNARYQTTIN